MPQVVALALIGAGLYAGYRWAAKKIASADIAPRAADAEVRRRAAERAGSPRDLGTLEWDAAAGVYKPKQG